MFVWSHRHTFIGFIVKMKIVMQKIVILINRESNKKFVKITLLQPYHAAQSGVEADQLSINLELFSFKNVSS